MKLITILMMTSSNLFNVKYDYLKRDEQKESVSTRFPCNSDGVIFSVLQTFQRCKVELTLRARAK